MRVFLLEAARTAFEAMQREKDDIIAMKNEEIEELKGKMNDMAHEFNDMLKETLGKMRERIEITDTSFQFGSGIPMMRLLEDINTKG